MSKEDDQREFERKARERAEQQRHEAERQKRIEAARREQEANKIWEHNQQLQRAKEQAEQEWREAQKRLTGKDLSNAQYEHERKIRNLGNQFKHPSGAQRKDKSCLDELLDMFGCLALIAGTAWHVWPFAIETLRGLI